jgi:hypothetical protein
VTYLDTRPIGRREVLGTISDGQAAKASTQDAAGFIIRYANPARVTLFGYGRIWEVIKGPC